MKIIFKCGREILFETFDYKEADNKLKELIKTYLFKEIEHKPNLRVIKLEKTVD